MDGLKHLRALWWISRIRMDRALIGAFVLFALFAGARYVYDSGILDRPHRFVYWNVTLLSSVEEEAMVVSMMRQSGWKLVLRREEPLSALIARVHPGSDGEALGPAYGITTGGHRNAGEARVIRLGFRKRKS